MPDLDKLVPGLESPAAHAAAVTPDDATDLATPACGLYVGGAGNLALVTVGGETVKLEAVPAGSFVPIRTARVRAAGTTATAIVALW